MKHCARCGSEKPPEQFHRDKNRPDGRYAYCKACVSRYQRGEDDGRPWRQHRKTALPTKTPTPVDIAWAAGFLEGEGSFSAKRRATGVYGSVTAPQVNREPLERLLAMFGGSIHQRSDGSISTWFAGGEIGRHVARAVYPLMSERRKRQIERSLPELAAAHARLEVA